MILCDGNYGLGAYGMDSVHILIAGLKFDGGTAAICRCALPTDRNAS